MYRCHSTVWVKQIPLRFCFNFSKTVGIMWVPFSEGPPPKICEGEKTSKIRRDFWQLSTLIAIIFGTDRHVESWRKTISNYNPFQVGPKNLVNFGPQTTESKWLILTNASGHFFGRLHFGPQGVLRPEIFTPATVWPRLPSAHPNWDGGPPQNFNREN